MVLHHQHNQRYDLLSRFLHWLVAIVIIYAMAMGYILHALEGTRWFNFFSVLNMSLGTIATPIMVLRFIWRFLRPSVPLPAFIPRYKKQLIILFHELFYLTIFVVLISGFLMLQQDYHLLGLIPVAHPVSIQAVNDFFFQIHRYSCILLGIFLIIHVAAVLRDSSRKEKNILRRML